MTPDAPHSAIETLNPTAGMHSQFPSALAVRIIRLYRGSIALDPPLVVSGYDVIVGREACNSSLIS